MPPTVKFARNLKRNQCVFAPALETGVIETTALAVALLLNIYKQFDALKAPAVCVFTVPTVPTLNQHVGNAGEVMASKFCVKAVTATQSVVKDVLFDHGLTEPEPQFERTYTKYVVAGIRAVAVNDEVFGPTVPVTVADALGVTFDVDTMYSYPADAGTAGSTKETTAELAVIELAIGSEGSAQVGIGSQNTLSINTVFAGALGCLNARNEPAGGVVPSITLNESYTVTDVVVTD